MTEDHRWDWEVQVVDLKLRELKSDSREKAGGLKDGVLSRVGNYWKGRAGPELGDFQG